MNINEVKKIVRERGIKQFTQLKNSSLPLVALLLIGGLLRFFKLGEESLWNDELATWVLGQQQSLWQVILTSGKDNTPPLFPILQYIIQGTLGDSEWALRAPSAIFGILSIWAIYRFGKSLYGKKQALVASACMCFFYVPIYYSQEARCYSLLLFLAIQSYHSWCKWFASLRSGAFQYRGVLWSYFFYSFFLMYTHYFGVLLILAQGLVLLSYLALTKQRPKFVSTFIIYELLATLFFPWFAYIYRYFDKLETFWIPRPTLHSFYELYSFFFNDSWILSGLTFLIMFSALVVGLLKYLQQKKQSLSIEEISLGLIGLLCVLIVYVKSLVSTSIFLPKYFIILLPLVYLFLAKSLFGLVKSTMISFSLSIFVIYFGFFDLNYRLNYFTRNNKKEEFKKAIYLLSRYPSGPQWPMISLVWNIDYLKYYLRRYNVGIQLGFNLPGTPQDMVILENFFQEIKNIPSRKDFTHFWFFTGHRVPEKQFLGELFKRHKVVRRAKLNGVSLMLFEYISPEKALSTMKEPKK